MFLKIFVLLVLIQLVFNSARKVGKSESYEDSCETTRSYHPNEWELKWLKAGPEISIVPHGVPPNKWHKGCSLMRDDEALVRKWMVYWNERQNYTALPDKGYNKFKEEGFPMDVFPYITVTKTCGSRKVLEINIPIEPLVGFLRHPVYWCFDRDYKYHTNKDYMITDFIYEAYPFQDISKINDGKPRRRIYYFDLGASLYLSGGGGASQSWFIDTYKSRGIVFDRILAWEGTFHSPDEIFNEYPPDVYSKVSYFNVLAQTGKNDSANPVRILKQIAHKDDYVVFKLDIDNAPVEMEFINQILEDSSISDLIDEFYFEHHVAGTPMERSWFGGPHFLSEQERKKHMNFMDSLELFRKLRDRGIKAHSWV